MTKISYQSRTTELNAAAIRILELYGKNTVSNDEFLGNLIDTLKSQSDRMTIAIRRSRALSELDEKDIARDEQIRALGALLKGYCKIPDEATQVAAKRVYAVFGKYGVAMAKVNYAEETALVESLLKDFAVAAVAADIASLSGVAEIVSHIAVAQKDFVSTRVEYEKNVSAEAGAENASDIKRELLDTINAKLVAYLTAMQLVDVGKYGAFAAAVAQIIDTNNETVRRRSLNLPEDVAPSPTAGEDVAEK